MNPAQCLARRGVLMAASFSSANATTTYFSKCGPQMWKPVGDKESLGTTPDPLNQNLHFNKVPGR